MPLRRYIFNTLTVVSLLLMLGMLGIWVRSLRYGVLYHVHLRPVWYRMQLSHWFLTLIFAILPAIWLFKWNKRRKLDPNACPACGYDLTGNESGVCPECGVALNTEAAQT